MAPGALTAGIDRMKVDLGLEQDPGRRFALWALLAMLGEAPDLDVAFKDERGREAARNFLDLVGRSDGALTAAQCAPRGGRQSMSKSVIRPSSRKSQSNLAPIVIAGRDRSEHPQGARADLPTSLTLTSP